jgi:periplasmic copper chaperone A
MRRCAVAAAAALALVAACGGDDGGSEALAITDAWARATPAGTTVGAVYFDVGGDSEDSIVGASVDPSVAAGVELHMTMALGDQSMTSVGGASAASGGSGEVTMHAVPQIFVPPGTTVALEPGSWHLMLVDLAAPLVTGESFDLTVDFATGDDQVVTVDVRNDAP